jgi:hypothetical protein
LGSVEAQKEIETKKEIEEGLQRIKLLGNRTTVVAKDRKEETQTNKRKRKKKRKKNGGVE